MMNLNQIFEMIIENKEWLFSGIGNTIGNALLSNMEKKSIDSYVTNVVKYVEIHNNDKYNDESVTNNVNKEVFELVDRFISVYENHDISISQIPSFTSDNFRFNLSNFKDKDSILEILNDDFINWTCKVFGIERDWIDGKSKRLYKHVNYYNNISNFIRNIVEL